MPDRTSSPYRSGPQTNAPAFTRYVADLLRPARTAPEPGNRDDLVASQLGFVVRAARRVAQYHDGTDVDILDLIQEGNVALLQAVQEWLDRPAEAAHFHTFVAQRVYRALRQYVADARRENATRCSLEEQWEELCQVEAPAELDPLVRLVYRQHQEVMIAMLNSLEQKRKQVVALRCGFCDGQERTYQEIGEALGFSAGRAAQLMASVRRMWRHPTRIYKLRDVRQDLG
jgi:RNA polymerase sigma factor (sigma-70 family)